MVELQPTPDTTTITTHLQEAAVLCADASPEGGGDKACVLLLQPLSNANHDLMDTESPPKQHAGDQSSDSMLGEMPPSSILYDTPGDSCEGSPLLPNFTPSHPSLTESTF